MDATELVYVPLPDAVLERLRAASKRERKSIEELVQEAVATFLERERRKDL